MTFPGIYRGICLNNQNSDGSLLLSVPQIFGDSPVLADPCRPVGDSAVPNVGATVWVAFEGGDQDHPVWVGVLS